MILPGEIPAQERSGGPTLIEGTTFSELSSFGKAGLKSSQKCLPTSQGSLQWLNLRVCLSEGMNQGRPVQRTKNTEKHRKNTTA